MATKVTGEQYRDFDGQFLEIKRQLRQRDGYPFDPEFLKNHLQIAIEGRFETAVGDLKITTAEFDPADLVGKDWKDAPGEEDKRSLCLKEVDFAKAKFVHCLKGEESSIKGEEKLFRLKENNEIRLGANVFTGLWKDYQSHKKNSVLERLYRAGMIKNYLDFFGTILLDPNDERRVLILWRDDDGWHQAVYWLRDDWLIGNLSAVLLQV